MSRATVFVMIGLLAGTLTAASAQEDTLSSEELNTRLSSIKNPFKSSLPEPQPEVTEPAPPVEEAGISTEGSTEEAPAIKAEPPPPPKFTITGVIWDTDRPQAIMNGQIVNIGDTISGVEIHNIEKTEISGLYFGQKIIIKP